MDTYVCVTGLSIPSARLFTYSDMLALNWQVVVFNSDAPSRDAYTVLGPFDREAQALAAYATSELHGKPFISIHVPEHVDPVSAVRDLHSLGVPV